MNPDGMKSVPFKVKAAGPDDGLGDGQFEGYASVFGNVDSYGDIVVKGAFENSLKEWDEKGDPIPLLWAHDMDDPFSNIGVIDHAEEDDHGLKVRGTFDTDNPKADQCYRLAKGRRATGMSFAYAIRDSEEKDDATYLKDLQIYEASIVPIGANPEAGVNAVKAAADVLLKHGRVLSSKNESSLREARDAIDSVLSSLEDEDAKAAQQGGSDQEQKASGTPEVTADASANDPCGGTASASANEPKASPSVDPYLAAISTREKEI